MAEPGQKTQVGISLMAINQVFKEAAQKGEKLSFFDLLSRSLERKTEIETKIQNQQLTDGYQPNTTD